MVQPWPARDESSRFPAEGAARGGGVDSLRRESYIASIPDRPGSGPTLRSGPQE